MADTDCTQACRAAFSASVGKLCANLLDQLSAAATDEERQKSRERFAAGMKLAKEVRDLCLRECG